MEFLTILLSGLLSILSPANFVLDRVAENAIRDQFDSAEEVHVRIDNAPSYQVLQGRVERVRIAGRGLFPQPGLRIEALEVETDPIAIDPQRIRRGRVSLDQPLQAGVRLVLNRDDMIRAFESPAIARRLQNLRLDALGGSQTGQSPRYDVVNPQVEFLENNRLRVQAALQERGSDRQIAISVETGLGVVTGQRLQLIDPIISLDNSPIPSQLIRPFLDGLTRQFDLQQLEASGVTVRVLQLKVEANQLAIAAFVRVEPRALASGN
ncbi:MAG TPA: DUF2993 domain-containing protein [Crinalium sp.]|jgi:hypothetical protein